MKFGVASGMLILCGGACAGPMDPRVVSADAAWALHVDVEAAVRSTVGKAALEDPEVFGIDAEDIQGFNEWLWMDVRKDLKGVTVYGRAGEDESAAATVLTTSAALDDAIRIKTTSSEVVPVVIDGKTHYQWIEGAQTWYGVVLPGRTATERRLAAATDRDTALAAARVVEGEAPSLAASGAARLKTPPAPGSIVFFAAVNIDGLLDAPQANMLQQAEGGVFDAGEWNGELFARLMIATKAPEEAANIAQVIQGILALARLAASDDPEAARFLKLTMNVTTTVQDGEVRLEWRSPAAIIVEALRQPDAAEPEPEEGNEGDEGS